ncbi:DUF397 domain-containing protein [Streptomyces sp. P38-E01]|uniref:DUF397 domain-containing protein n=1 Tax=Streptomyces tardus TaxID=2780544 RepID=A0A949JPU2_9ACTN|nr:DUF397 domain-containing protein [Streptomyces tardus]MBU7598045.1 DUF397 domain-containing protein [Streptomyces tardus]
MKTNPDAIPEVKWRKSSYSGSDNAQCVEVADGDGSSVPVRDSKCSQGPILVFRALPWAAFVNGVKVGDFDG